MAFLSLVPALGAGLVWAPVAIYLIGTGDLARASASSPGASWSSALPTTSCAR